MSMDLSLSRAAENRLEALENGSLCLELRRSGMSMAKIAETLGLQVTNVRRLLTRALRETVVVDVNETRALEASRFDTALEAIWPEVMQGNLRAIDRMLRISRERRSLFGLDQQPQTSRDEEFNGPALLEIVPYQPDPSQAKADDAVVPASIEGVAE